VSAQVHCASVTALGGSAWRRRTLGWQGQAFSSPGLCQCDGAGWRRRTLGWQGQAFSPCCRPVSFCFQNGICQNLKDRTGICQYLPLAG